MCPMRWADVSPFGRRTVGCSPECFRSSWPEYSSVAGMSSSPKLRPQLLASFDNIGFRDLGEQHGSWPSIDLRLDLLG